MNAIETLYSKLSLAGEYLSMLLLRLLLAWEFGSAGLRKLDGANWFDQIVDQFPFPFNMLPTDISWFLATWSEVLGAIGKLSLDHAYKTLRG